MATTVRSLEAARQATVRICNSAGEHHGQGLLLDLEAEGTVVLTCHHIVARLAPEELHVSIPQPSGELGEPIQASYDADRSRPGMDAVVLRISRAGPPERPLLHALNERSYSGTLPERALCLGHWKADSFDARLAVAARLDVGVDTPGTWPHAPARYTLPFVFRLAEPSDARPGISGSVVLYDNAVLGLAHFSRPAGPDQEREVYLVPLNTWANGWPALADLIEPLIDARLRSAAIVKHARSLEAELDVSIAGYRPDIYLELSALGQASAALQKHGGVVIVGRPKSGKTRLAWQLLRASPDSLVVIPDDPRPPSSFEASSLAGREMFLFFDDLHRTALSGDPVGWRRSLEAATQCRCQIICTARDGADWKQLESSGASRLLEQLGKDAIIYTSRVGTEGADLSAADGLKLAQALGIGQSDFVHRFDGTPGSLTLDLADMRQRYQRLRDEERAGIAMSRLLDAAKLVYEASQPRLRASVLRFVAERIRGDGRISTEAWETLQRRTREEGFGQFDSASGDFRTYKPYLEDCIAYTPSTAETEALIDVLVDVKDADGLGHLGQALLMRMESYTEAARALQAAVDLGNDSVRWMIGCALENIPGREAEAESYLRGLIAAGGHSQYANLGAFLAGQPGRQADAEEAFRNAIELGDPLTQMSGYFGLGNLLIGQEGREQEAEQAYRKAADSGVWLAHRRLAEILVHREGREQEAEQTISDTLAAIEAQRALLSPEGEVKPAAKPAHTLLDADFGSVLGLRGIVLARQEGRAAEAEAAYRDAIKHGTAESHLGLGALLALQEGRQEEAERAYRDAVEAGVEGSAANLGRYLAQRPGREAEAEHFIRQGIDEGYALGSYNLGLLLQRQPGRAEDAEHAFRDAIDAGSLHAREWLGYVLEQQEGREQEAESAYRSAIAAGLAHAGVMLGNLLSRLPVREKDAETAYWDAARQGDQGTWQPLSQMIVRRWVDGDRTLDEWQKQIIDQAVDADNSYALFALASVNLLGDRPTTEGIDMLRKSAAAGVELAADLLRGIGPLEEEEHDERPLDARGV